MVQRGRPAHGGGGHATAPGDGTGWHEMDRRAAVAARPSSLLRVPVRSRSLSSVRAAAGSATGASDAYAGTNEAADEAPCSLRNHAFSNSRTHRGRRLASHLHREWPQRPITQQWERARWALPWELRRRLARRFVRRRQPQRVFGWREARRRRYGRCRRRPSGRFALRAHRGCHDPGCALRCVRAPPFAAIPHPLPRLLAGRGCHHRLSRTVSPPMDHRDGRGRRLPGAGMASRGMESVWARRPRTCERRASRGDARARGC